MMRLDMFRKGVAKLQSGLGWLIRRPGCQLFCADDANLSAQDVAAFKDAWWEAIVWSLGWGLIAIWAWSASWCIFKDPAGFLVRPAIATWAVLLLWPYRRAIIHLTEMVAPSPSTFRMLMCSLFVLMPCLLLVSLETDPYRAEYWLPWALRWIRPDVKIYRVLLVMPLWGAWAMLITMQFCKGSDKTESAVREMSLHCTPVRAAIGLAAALSMTILYFSYCWAGIVAPVVCIAVAISTGFWLCRRQGGLNRAALLVTNIVTQFAFLLSYIASK